MDERIRGWPWRSSRLVPVESEHDGFRSKPSRSGVFDFGSAIHVFKSSRSAARCGSWRLGWQAVEGADDEVDPVSMPPLDGFVVCTEGCRETTPGEEMPFGDGAY